MKGPWKDSLNVIYRLPVDCGKCTRYGNEYVSYDRCTKCMKNRDLPIRVVKLGKIFSRVVFEGELVQRIVLTSRLRTTVEERC